MTVTFKMFVESLYTIYQNLSNVMIDIWNFFFSPLSYTLANHFGWDEFETEATLLEIIDFIDSLPFTPSWVIDMYSDILMYPLIVTLLGTGLTLYLILSVIKWVIGIVT